MSSRSRGRPDALHLEERFERADTDGHPAKIDVQSVDIEFAERRHWRKPLEDVDWPGVSRDECPVSNLEEGGYRARAEPPFGSLDTPAERDEQLREPRQIARIGVGDDVHILRATEITPGVDRKAADQDEAHVRADQSLEQLPRPDRLGHLRAAPRKLARNSIRARPSARFTASGRRASSRRRRRRTTSFSTHGSSRDRSGRSTGCGRFTVANSTPGGASARPGAALSGARRSGRSAARGHRRSA
jgi:hypothetical protein